MISVTGNRNGFSLLELIITMALIAIVVGFFVVHVSFDNRSQALDQFRFDLERLVIKTARSSNAFGEDRVITISQVALTSGTTQLAIPDGCQLRLRRSNESELRLPNSDTWLFYPGGLIEPIAFELRNDSSFYRLTFDPLSARPMIE